MNSTSSNWQLVEPSTKGPRSTVEVGVTWARGLLEERVEDTGALALVLTALRRELERPVELGSGRTGVPRVTVELDADVCEIRIRGVTQTVRAATQRFAHLFTRPLIAEGLTPHSLPFPLWTEDVLARTGSSALALRGLDAMGDGAREEARRLLRELDPWRGTVNCVFWTDEESLLGTVDDVAPLRPSQDETTWADGTPRWRPGSAPGPAVLSSPGSAELLSVMVPRTVEGHTAGELLRISLAEALAAADSEWTKISLQVQGMGEGFRVVLSTSPPLQDEKRPQVLTELLRRVGRLPDSWIASVLLSTSCPSSLERGRRVRGLGDGPEGTVDGVRQALADAERSIHLALEPTLLDFAAHSRLAALPVRGPAREDPAVPVRIFDISGRAKRSGGSDPSTRVRLARSTLAVEDSSTGPEVPVVDLTRLVAVLDSPSGARRLIDRAGSSVTIRPADLDEGEQLETYLTHTLRRVPRLSLEDRAPRTHPGVRHRRERGLVFLAVGVVAAMIILFGIMPALDDADDEASSQEAWSTQELSWDETAELSNGTRITASQPTVEEDEQRTYRATITFCGGADTEGLRSDGEPADEMVQNIVRSEDFTLYSGSGAELPLHEGAEAPEDLQSDWLDDGECTTGDVRFSAMGMDSSSLVYRNGLGDKVTWSAP